MCNEVPEEGYAPSRAARSDWICTKCNNKKKANWWRRVKERRLKEHEAAKRAKARG